MPASQAYDAALLPEIASHLSRSPQPNLLDLQGGSQPMRRVSDVWLQGHSTRIFGRLYEPMVACRFPQPVVLFLHGGGWSRGNVQLYDTPCRALAEASQCAVLYVDYRLLPEHPFPAALLDASAALNDLIQHSEDWDCDPGRIAVVGDSAGGNLAAALCLMLRDNGGPEVLHQVLIYPPLNAARTPLENSHRYKDPMLSEEQIALAYSQYAGSTSLSHEWLSPLQARSLAGVPSATLFAAELDPLFDDTVRYADSLRGWGVPAECIHLAGMPHMCFHMRGISAASRRIYDEIGLRLIDALGA